jgi:hypothetical protein
MDFVTSFRNSVLQYFNNYQKVHKKIANQYSGRCFILGNGPSLNEQDLSLLRNEHCFVTNRFVLHNNFEVVDPNFYCMADPEFLVKNERIILKKIKKKLTINKEIQLYISNRYFLSYWFRKTFKDIDVNYIYFRPDKQVKKEKTLSVDLKRGVYYGNTIVIDFCIPLALIMGFDEIILLGCDLNYASGNSHFHGHREGTENKSKGISRNQWVKEVDRSYGICNEYANTQGVKLLDATEGGKINTLEKTDYLKLF